MTSNIFSVAQSPLATTAVFGRAGFELATLRLLVRVPYRPGHRGLSTDVNTFMQFRQDGDVDV